MKWRKEGRWNKREEQPWVPQRSTNTPPIKLHTLSFCKNPWAALGFRKTPLHSLKTQAVCFIGTFQSLALREGCAYVCSKNKITTVFSIKYDNPIHLKLLLRDAGLCVQAPSFLWLHLCCRFDPSADTPRRGDVSARITLQLHLF